MRHRARGSMTCSTRRSGGRRLLLASLVVGSIMVAAAALVPGARSVTGSMHYLEK